MYAYIVVLPFNIYKKMINTKIGKASDKTDKQKKDKEWYYVPIPVEMGRALDFIVKDLKKYGLTEKPDLVRNLLGNFIREYEKTKDFNVASEKINEYINSIKKDQQQVIKEDIQKEEQQQQQQENENKKTSKLLSYIIV